jgi:hypothetical protein
MTAYVVYQIADSRYAGKKGHYDDPIFDSLAAAKAHKTRMVKTGKFTADQIAVAELGLFRDYIEQIVQRTHLLNGAPLFERINTPHYCSPSSETYWSM